MARRVAEVLKLLGAGESRLNIVQYCSKKWKITDRHADTLIAKAREELKPLIERDKDVILDEFSFRLDALYARALKAKKYKVCLDVAREKADRLLGRPHQRVEVDGKLHFKVVPDDEDIEETPDGAL